MLADQQKITFVCSVQILESAKRTGLEWWTRGMDGEVESSESMRSACIDVDDEIPCSLRFFPLWWPWWCISIYVAALSGYRNNDYVKKMSFWWLIWFVGFYGISTFVGYLTPKPFNINKQFYLKQFTLA